MKDVKFNDSQVKGALVFVALLWGINPIVIKLGITQMSPMIFTTLRLFVAVLAFTFFLVRSKTWVALTRKSIIVFIKMGTGAFVFQLGMILALQFVSAAIVATMIGLVPISTLVIYRFKGMRKIMNYHYFGTLITFGGVFLVSGLLSGVMTFENGNTLLGITLLFMAQFAAASYIVLSENILKVYSHYQVSTMMFSVVFIMFLIITVPEMATQGIDKITGPSFYYIIYGGIVSLCIANNLSIWGIKKLGSHRAVIYNNLPPVFALIAGILFLNEIPMPSQVIGIGTILFGLYIFSGKWAQVIALVKRLKH